VSPVGFAKRLWLRYFAKEILIRFNKNPVVFWALLYLSQWSILIAKAVFLDTGLGSI
jgi:hypothetical protein